MSTTLYVNTTSAPALLNVASATNTTTSMLGVYFATSTTFTATNVVVMGGGACRLNIASMLDQVRLMDGAQLDDFLFRVVCERYRYDPETAALSPQEYAIEAARGRGHVIPGGTYQLPDGASLTVERDGNYSVSDKEARVTYKSNRNREFNEYVNVSDVLERFMQYTSQMQITRKQFLEIPIQTFLMWLIIEAARKDGDTVRDDDVKQLELALGPPMVSR